MLTTYEDWLKQAQNDPELLKQLKKMNSKEKEEAFQMDLSFGTGGMRGIMGAGPNRMNVYTIRKANYGLGKYLLKKYKSDVYRGVVISHDNRLNSREFALESAKVLGALGIKCYIFDMLRSTPELSFSVRYTKACAGVMVTASHNPPIYNGYKIYDEDGCQFTPDYADQVIEEINSIENMFDIPTISIESMKELGLLKELGEEVDNAFIEKAKSVQLYPNLEKKIKVVYSPLHGTGTEITKKLMDELGYDFTYVEQQMKHDPYFKTLELPNPEDPKAFTLAEEIGRKVNADLLIATDPDADRVGIGVWDGAKYNFLTGNQTGAVLLYFRLLKEKQMKILPKKGRVFNTIVTSELGAKVAQSFGFKVTSTLTGFKYIGEQAKLLESSDEEFIFGYEESYGYIIKDYVRDKDSIQSLLAITEMANYLKVKEDRNICDLLKEVYDEYGYFKEYTRNIFFEGVDGPEKMASVTNYFRNNDIRKLGDIDVLVKEDYETSVRTKIQKQFKSKLILPKSDVIKYYLDGDSWAVVRPSGTEPKLKIYYSAKSDSLESAQEIIDRIDSDMKGIVTNVTGKII